MIETFHVNHSLDWTVTSSDYDYSRVFVKLSGLVNESDKGLHLYFLGIDCLRDSILEIGVNDYNKWQNFIVVVGITKYAALTERSSRPLSHVCKTYQNLRDFSAQSRQG